jgi:hypothetical protein
VWEKESELCRVAPLLVKNGLRFHSGCYHIQVQCEIKLQTDTLTCLSTRDTGSWRKGGNYTEMSALSVSYAIWEVERWTQIAAAVEKILTQKLAYDTI